jgi:hypothetical protein
MGTAYRSCKLSNVGSPKTAMHRRKWAREIDSYTATAEALRFPSDKATPQLEEILLDHFPNPAGTIPATTCAQPLAWACIGMRGLEPDCVGSAQYSKAPL